MTGRFDHLKKKGKNLTLDEFVKGANVPESKSILAKKRPKKDVILLSINGKINRDECGKPVLLFIKSDIESEMEKYCVGSKQAIINYLISRGLEAIKEKGEFLLETA